MPEVNATLVGSADRQLDELLRAAGAHVLSITESGLAPLSTPDAAQPDVIIIDQRGKATLPPAVAVIRRVHPGTGIIVVASSLDPALLLEAMHAGVTEVVSDPLAQEDIESAMARVAGRRATTQVGEVFGFVGAKGGVGTTTVAVNVATALGSMAKTNRVLLVDLHQVGGDAAIFLGAEPRFSIIDALNNIHRLDQTLFRGLIVQVAPNTELLAAPERAGAVQLDATKVRKLIDFASTTYKYTVIDLPRSDGAILDALDHLSAVIIVVNQELATVKGASRLAASLRQRYGREKVSLVLSRSDRQAEIGSADVERAIGFPVAHTFPSDYRHALHALNKGRPIALDNHNELAGAFKRFAFQLTGVRPQPPQTPRSGLLGRLTMRRQ